MRFLVIVAVVLGADLYLKAWSFEHVAGRPVKLTPLAVEQHQLFWTQYEHESWRVVPGVLNLHLTTNTGAVFGMGKGGRVFFIVVSIVAVGIIGYLFARSRNRAWVLHTALALILGGALGNLYDRALYGAVRDMLHLFPTTRLWPWLFNLADAALVVGVVLVLAITLIGDLRQKRQPQPAGESTRG